MAAHGGVRMTGGAVARSGCSGTPECVVRRNKRAKAVWLLAAVLLYACRPPPVSPLQEGRRPVTSVLVAQDAAPGSPALADDLAAAGFHVLGAIACDNLVRDALRQSPDVLVCWQPRAADPFFNALSTLLANAALPVVVFTNDPEVEAMEKALAAGVQCWEVQGYAPQRLRAVVQLAQVRFRHDREQREAMAELSSRFEERKLIDRAKGILMRSQQMSEEEAFRQLRTASMHGNQRVGQVSQQIIEMARYADAINRAGQLRMLSQRLVKLYALACAGTEAAATRALLLQSVERVDNNLEVLAKLLSRPTFGDLLDAALAPWAELRAPLSAPADVAQLQNLDTLAERLLAQAERLTTALESCGLASTLHVINVCGRQRMLSQRLAKQALLSHLLQGAAARGAEAEAKRIVAEFDQALQYLGGVPLSTRDIREGLATAARTWGAMLAAVQRVHEPDGRLALAGSSEALLELFDRLTGQYEHSMQGLMG